MTTVQLDERLVIYEECVEPRTCTECKIVKPVNEFPLILKGHSLTLVDRLCVKCRKANPHYVSGAL